MDTEITYKSMGIWTELEVTTQSFSSGGARAYLVAKVSPDKPAGLKEGEDVAPLTILLSQSDMRRLALQLLMETLG